MSAQGSNASIPVPSHESSPYKVNKINDHSATLNPGVGPTRKQNVEIMYRKFNKALEEDYLKEFVPECSETGAPVFKKIFKNLKAGSREIVVQEAVIKAINNHNLCPGYKAVECHRRPDANDKTRQKPDAGLYLLEEAPTDGRPNWDKQRLNIEFKDTDDVDPFEDWGNDFEPLEQQRWESRGQVISYAEMMFLRQQLSFCFSIIIMGNQARIIRWDRSGAVVTKRFDYTRKEHLARFLWRFAHLSAEQQGYDPTATRVDPDSPDGLRMLAHAEPVDGEHRSYIREYFKKSLDRSYPWWRLKIEVKAETPGPPPVASGSCANAKAEGSHHDAKSSLAGATKIMGEYLVGKPHFAARGMAGRGTRGYVALDCATKQFVWLKDAWRVDQNNIRKEGDILCDLNNLGIENIPTYITHGDILEQRTRSQDYWNVPPGPSGRESPFKAHAHYRLVVKEICRPLRDFESGPELLWIIIDCLQAHQGAYEKAKILHRDISAGNILIYEVEVKGKDGVIQMERRGYLCDWELSKPLALNQFGPRQPDRTGTWQFLSVHALDDPTRTITLQDELESFVHVIIFYCVRWLRHSLKDVGGFMNDFFDSHSLQGHHYKASWAKRDVIEQGQLRHVKEAILFYFNDHAPTQDVKDVSEQEQDGHSKSDDSDGEGSAKIRSDDAVQQHPLNAALKKILGWFASYYFLIEPKEPASDQEPNIPKLPALHLVQRGSRLYEVLSDDEDERDLKREQEKRARAMQEAEVAAQNLNDHNRLSHVLIKAATAYWKDNCKLDDQLPPNYKPPTEKRLHVENRSKPSILGKRLQTEIGAVREEESNKRLHIDPFLDSAPA